jgi:hypothetical protein
MASGAAARRVVDTAAGLRGIAGIFEFIGWLGVVGAFVLAIAIGSQTQSSLGTDILGDPEFQERKMVFEGIVVGMTVGLASLFEVAVARVMRLLADYATAQMGEAAASVAPAAPTADDGPPF